jgi:sec-independent protein translocase protein TatA
MRLGVPELLLIFAIAVLIFGAGKLPQLGKGLGDGIRNFKEAVKEGEKPPTDKTDKKDS